MEKWFKKMFQLDSLSSTGAEFDLPASIKSGNYSINAYTLWMLNFPEFVYRKNIFIYGGDYSTKVSATKQPKLSMYFSLKEEILLVE